MANRGSPKAHRYSEIGQSALTGAPASLAVDRLGLPYGRGALVDAALAAARAEHIHQHEVQAPKRNEELRAALIDAIAVSERITALANLTRSGFAAKELAEAARADLEQLPAVSSRPRGSPGRPTQRAAAEAAARVWAAAESRDIPRAGIKEQEHPLRVLLDHISRDLFGRPGLLTGAHLRPLKK